MSNTPDTPLQRRLAAEVRGDVLFDAFSRGRYATDASIYQIMPVGAVVPETVDDAIRAVALAREEGVTVLPRGGGTSQCGQTVNSSLVVDCSKRLTRILDLDVAGRTARVEPGIVLDDFNRQLKKHGLWYPVDVSTASRATIGGMTANNSCGGRSLRYGTMRDNVIQVEAALADGTRRWFGEVSRDDAMRNDADLLTRDLLTLGTREAAEVEARYPKVQRRVGGYNLDALVPKGAANNMAHILVGSEGTLAFTTAVDLKLWPLLGPKVFGICHFGSFHEAMDAAQHLVTLKPIAVELVDRTMIGLARDIAMFRPTVERVVRGDPDALLVVEFAEETEAQNLQKLRDLEAMMGDLGFIWQGEGARFGGVVPVTEPAWQAAVTEMRSSGLNIMMSMKEAGKPVSFVEDCAVPLPDLAAYTAGLTEIFRAHGTEGTWYAHASVGCLHVRPVLNMKLDVDAKRMRSMAEQAFELVRHYKGSHSGEHGDGIVRSEFHREMFGERLVRAFEEVKDRFDPEGLFNPGKITRAPAMDDRTLFRYPPGYEGIEINPALDWSDYPGASQGFLGAIEMCNNNGTCRKLDGGAMCPSYRVTRDEQHVTRGRANTLRLAMTGQLGPDALLAPEMEASLSLCVSCKACKRECPTGVDMARMKIEVKAQRYALYGAKLHDRLVAHLPRFAPLAAKAPWLFNLRDRVPALKALSEKFAQFSARRTLPRWRSDIFAPQAAAEGPEAGREVVLFADTFNRAFERENLDAAVTVLTRAGYRVHHARPVGGGRALCCGRTYLATGMVDRARAEADRLVAALSPFAARGVPVIGLEPSCLFSLRDEVPALLKSEEAAGVAKVAVLFEEFLAAEAKAGRLSLPLGELKAKAVLHGHCHQKAFGAMGAVEGTLRLIPGLEVETVESSCCGMAGAFGYHAETIDASLAMAELSLLPAIRKAPDDALIVADGTSCRHQIADGAGREAVHVARVLAMSLEAAETR
ncbi:MAG: FAD-linked oxidase C-terminal domain-containing protein [Phreatobacter sp.]|uniref:FAD-binding and (Fe-S)-binding domain-containing protein n=1 Tax=Phreatobacter sp. TaxID=1966341 RepID=UPI002734C497|nr:FAD-binding and (Fe-S)-binding domain-containing protein [Phreatobacter sp.]MDP2800687.1 FAD-linked oxidase C-terminal domain-containing protein [Phreatobacter sp.]